MAADARRPTPGYRNGTTYADRVAMPVFDPRCPDASVPVRIGDKWTAMIVLCLQDEPRRFGELRAGLPRITAKVLTETLRAMQRDGMVTRHERPDATVDYALTPLGRSLLDLVAAARAWCAEHLDELNRARG